MQTEREVLRQAFGKKISHRSIGRNCGVSHNTVSRYYRIARQAGLNWAGIAQMDDESLARLLRNEPQRSTCFAEPDWATIHRELRKDGVTLLLLWQEYRISHPDGYSYSSFTSRYRTWLKAVPSSMRQIHRAGEKVFVDYSGQTMPITDRQTGEIRTAQIFVGVLGASGYTYAEATMSQTVPDWVTSHARMFEFFGGVPDIVVCDNLKSAVISRPRGEAPVLNRTYLEMARHYGVFIAPTRPRKPKDKPKAELGVKLVQRWILSALRDRPFYCLQDLNLAIVDLLAKLNGKAIRRLKVSRRDLFQQQDKPALHPLPEQSYQYAQWIRTTASNDYHVYACHHYYSVPYVHSNALVDVRVTQGTVEVFRNNLRIAIHAKGLEDEGYTTLKEHMPANHRAYAESSLDDLLEWARKTGPSIGQMCQWAIETKRHREQSRRFCGKLKDEVRRFGAERVDAACKVVLAMGIADARNITTIHRMLGKGMEKAPTKSSDEQRLPDHDNIRGGDYYDDSGEATA